MGKKILIVDDDQTNVRTISSRLEKEGFSVSIALDGDVGLEKVKKEHPDIIILDVEMPRMNGYTFMLELGRIEGYKPAAVIVLTAHHEMQPIFEHRGVHGYFVKPVNFDKLIEKIKACLPA